jgi:hypothetical protein
MKQLDVARKYLKNADHLLLMTYPSIKETRLFLPILQNIFLSFSNALDALLLDQFNKKKIGMFDSDFESRIKIYRLKIEKKNNLDSNYYNTLLNIKKLLILHKVSPIEFERHEKFIICSESYEINQITEKLLNEYLIKAKLFIEDTDAIINKNG